MKKNKKIKAISLVLWVNLIIIACTGQGEGYDSNSDNVVNSDRIVSENIISSDVIIADDVSGDAIPVGVYEGRAISYNVEDYISLNIDEIYTWLKPYGFCIRSNQNGDGNWICRYTEDGKEDMRILFGFNKTGQLEHICINDFGYAEEKWNLHGMNCQMTVEEMEDRVKEQGAAIFGHNMVLYGSGIGFEKLGIGKISWGCGSDYIDYLDIDINTDYIDFLQDVTCDIESRKMEFVTEIGTFFSIEYPVFISEGDKVFDVMNERLWQMVEENGEALCQAENRDNILYEIECLETQAISISFYRSGDYHYQSLFTFNYDLVNEDFPEMPDYLLEELKSHRKMWEESGPYDILNWYINPMQVHVLYYNQIPGEVKGVDFWRR